MFATESVKHDFGDEGRLRSLIRILSHAISGRRTGLLGARIIGSVEEIGLLRGIARLGIPAGAGVGARGRGMA